MIDVSQVTDIKFSAEIVELPIQSDHPETSPELIDGPHPEDQSAIAKPEVEPDEEQKSEYDNVEQDDDSSEYEEVEIEVEVTDSEADSSDGEPESENSKNNSNNSKIDDKVESSVVSISSFKDTSVTSDGASFSLSASSESIDDMPDRSASV